MNIARVFVDAVALWRHDRDLWIRVASFYFFVPVFAVLLFVQPSQVPVEVRPGDLSALAQQMLVTFRGQAWWLVPLTVWKVYSLGVVLILVLDPARPSLATAILRALRMLPGLMLAYLGAGLLVGAGLGLFIVPGLYLVGRTMLTQPILVAEPHRGPIGALIVAVQRSHRRGWTLFFVLLCAILMQLCAESLVSTVGALLGGATNGLAHLVFSALGAAVIAAGSLAQALLQAAAYRELCAARQGI
ncbi:MAG: hypothetical protein V4574_15990 [Pseudomonadota bacterium]